MSGTDDRAVAAGEGSSIRWLWLFIDHPSDTEDTTSIFWAAATRSTLSPQRGDSAEFRTLEPAAGDPCVRLQRVGADTGADTAGLHLDLDVDDPDAAAARAVALGAEVIAVNSNERFAVLRSPGGFVFCFTNAADGPAGRTEPPAHRVREGEPDLLDQVCLDIPADRWNTEVAFWSNLTGWPARSGVRDEFAYLKQPKAALPLRILLQRTESPAGRVTAHPDMACVDREATVDRLVGLGAHIVQRMPWWTVLRDPTGRAFCVIARDPVTGRIG